MSDGGHFTAIPRVDLGRWHGSAAERAALAREVRGVCHEVGFALLTGHGIAPRVIDDVFDAARELFALPHEHKLLIDKRNSRHFRGWEPEGAEFTNARPDIREQLDLWTEHPPRAADAEPPYLRLLGPNQWLPESVLPGFRARVTTWLEAMERLAGELMRLLAVSLALEEDYFARYFGDERMSLAKLIRYPVTPAGQFGVNAHHDTGFLTLLSPDGTPGLEVRNAAGGWITVPVVPDALVVNLGEMLQAVTGNYFVATPHRVVTRAPRQSVGFFYGPSLNTPLTRAPLAPEFAAAVAASARHRDAGFMAQRDETACGVADMASPHHPDVYGQQLWNYFVRSYPANVARHYPDSVAAAAADA